MGPGPAGARPPRLRRGQARIPRMPRSRPLKLPQIKNKPEQSELCSDVAERMGFEPM